MPESNIGPSPRRGGFPQKNPSAPSLSGGRGDYAGGTVTRLLVSVRSAEEALIAAGAGADIIDVKEPKRGPLGAADPEVWQQVAAGIRGAQPLSAALGEAAELDAKGQLESVVAAIPSSFRFAKIGPAGASSLARIEPLWQRARVRLPNATEFVGVAYADWRAARCPPPEELLASAARLGIRWWLLDTFEKRGATVIDVLGAQRLAEIGQQARSLSMQWVLAGSMRRQETPVWKLWQPTVVGVRGDVCRGRREGVIDPESVGLWKRLLKGLY